MRKMRKNVARRGAFPKGTESVLGLKRFAAISAVEGLELSAKGRKRVLAPMSTQKRRAEIIRAYLDPKGNH